MHSHYFVFSDKYWHSIEESWTVAQDHLSVERVIEMVRLDSLCSGTQYAVFVGI